MGGAAALGLDLLALLEDGGHGACGIRLTLRYLFLQLSSFDEGLLQFGEMPVFV